MTLAFAMVFVGALTVYAGWTNRNLIGLIKGDKTQAKTGSGWATSGAGVAPANAPTPPKPTPDQQRPAAGQPVAQ